MIRVIQRTLFAILALAPAMACATIINVPALRDQIGNAAVVARVELTSTEILTSPADKSVICGYLYHVHIKEIFKGQPGSDIEVYSEENNDTMDDESNYLLIASSYTTQNPKPRRFTDDDRCKNVSEKFNYYVSNLNQSLFPLWMDHDTGSPYKLYVGRKSAFTPGNFVGANDLITTFVIDGDRIFAVVDYKKAIDMIKLYCVQAK